jgi:hypothetical protein
MKAAILAAACALLAAATARADDYYVDPETGSMSNDGSVNGARGLLFSGLSISPSHAPSYERVDMVATPWCGATGCATCASGSASRARTR